MSDNKIRLSRNHPTWRAVKQQTPSGLDYILVGTISYDRSGAIKKFTSGEYDSRYKDNWRKAYRDGYRTCLINIEQVPRFGGQKQ